MTIRLTLPAKMFSGMHDESVVLIEERSVWRQTLLKKRANMIVRFPAVKEVMAFENAAGVGIHDKDGMLAGVEKDRVSGLRANAVNGEELLTELGGGRGKKPVKRAPMGAAEKSDEFLHLAGLLAKIAGGADESSETGEGNALNGGGREQICSTKLGDGPLHIGPTGVLSQDSPNNNLKTGAARPPVLWPVSPEQSIIVKRKLGQSSGFRGMAKLAGMQRRAVAKARTARQNAGGRHLLRKIAVPSRQVKKEGLYRGEATCTGGQVLANSQRWFKIERRGHIPFAMLSGGCSGLREFSECRSVWAKFY
ncbi:MAG TPA: hypothetical protein VED66_01785 [Candidatus Sulfotelmatobacter sp.]|nr:hypothetical protein [Candidatus Sulfotelmatobacter sp.]